MGLKDSSQSLIVFRLHDRIHGASSAAEAFFVVRAFQGPNDYTSNVHKKQC